MTDLTEQDKMEIAVGTALECSKIYEAKYKTPLPEGTIMDLTKNILNGNVSPHQALDTIIIQTEAEESLVAMSAENFLKIMMKPPQGDSKFEFGEESGKITDEEITILVLKVAHRKDIYED